jgi:hypothetical protein
VLRLQTWMRLLRADGVRAVATAAYKLGAGRILGQLQLTAAAALRIADDGSHEIIVGRRPSADVFRGWIGRGFDAQGGAVA